MKSLHGRTDKSMSPVSRLKRGIVTCAVAASMAFGMPLTEAKAAPAPAAAKQLYTVTGMKDTLNYNGEKRTIYAMASTTKPVVKFDGPAEVTVRVYPAVPKGFFKTKPDFVHNIECSSGPESGAQSTGYFSGKTHASNIQHQLVGPNIEIGSPIEFTVKVPGKGPQQLTVTKPNGFFEVVGVKPVRVKPKVPPRRKIKIRVSVDPPKKVKKIKKPAPKPARTLFTTDAVRIHIDGLGPNANKGDVNGATVLGHIPVHKNVSLLVGTHVNSFGLAFDTTEASTSIRSLSTNLVLGVNYTRAKHSLTAFGFGGYRHMWTRVSPVNDTGLKDESSEAEGGGALAYAYSKYLVLSVLGKNDHFNPLTVRAYGALHKGLPWVKGSTPSLDVTYSLLRAAVSIEQEGRVGGAKMSHIAHDMIAVADIPFLRLKMFTLSAVAGMEMTIPNDGGFWATGLFGGALGFDHKGVSVRFTGYSSLEGQPFMFLNFAYSR